MTASGLQLREQHQLNAVADEVGALTAVVRPILTGLLYGIKAEKIARVGGHDKVELSLFPSLYRAGDGDAGICFEYAVHDALKTGVPSVVERVADALSKHCNISGDEVTSLLFGMEKAGSQQLIETAASTLTDESRLMTGKVGQPVKLKAHLNRIAAAFRKPQAKLALPSSISGLWRADLFLGLADADRWVGTTVKINPRKLEGAKGLRVGIVPAEQGASDRIHVDDRKNLVVCPMPYDADFVETFYSGWEVVQAFIAADAQMPKPVALPRSAAREVARRLVDRRDYPILDVVEALRPLAQPELLRTEEQVAVMTPAGGKSETVDVGSVLAPQPILH